VTARRDEQVLDNDLLNGDDPNIQEDRPMTITKEVRKPSSRQQRFLAAFGGLNKTAKLKDLGDIAFKRERPAAKRFSWARNQARWLLENGFIERAGKKGDGEYKRVK
jgi:hypothetical protein